MGQALFLTQFNALVEFLNGGEIAQINRYMVPTFDLRTRSVFTISFPDQEKVFHFQDSDEAMYPRIMRWLKTGEE